MAKVGLGGFVQRIDVYWRDIPSQVLIKRGRERGKYLLSHRFQAAIDRAAMRAGKGGSDAYLEEWRRVTTSIDSDSSPHALAEALGQSIEQQFSDDDLARLVANKGFNEAD